MKAFDMGDEVASLREGRTTKEAEDGSVFESYMSLEDFFFKKLFATLRTVVNTCLFRMEVFYMKSVTFSTSQNFRTKNTRKRAVNSLLMI